MKPKVIFIDTVHPILFERLTAAGYDCEWKTDLNREEIAKLLPAYFGAVIRSKFRFDKALLDSGENLKWIARSGSGMENIDLAHAASKGIRCYNSPEGNRDAVAEHAIAMLLNLFNKLNTADLEVRKGIWEREKNRGIELKGKTVGIIGYGFMGEAFAKRLTGFSANVIAYDKYKSNFSTDVVKEAGIDELKKEADIISLHLPYTDETHYFLNDDFIAEMEKPFYLINTSRGKIVDTLSLNNGLNAKKVLGACLDVLEIESSSFENFSFDQAPPYFQNLIKQENVLLSPHVAGWTIESYEKLSAVLADKILAEFQP